MSGLYVHIPFCKSRCHYCDFVSSTNVKKIPHYLELLKKEFDNKKALSPFALPNHFETLYFGGGTPSLINEKELVTLFDAIAEFHPSFDKINLALLKEVTFEMNPADVTLPKLKLLKELGASRISLGVQSFDEEQLFFLGRRHTKAEALTAIELIQKTDFQSFSVDLIFGLPNESGDLPPSFEIVKELGVPHLSCYNLILEEGTPLYEKVKSGKNRLPSEECDEKTFFAIRNFLTQNGYQHYELSNYALPGEESIHNANYWTGKPYLGVGPGAHSFLPSMTPPSFCRGWNGDNFEEWESQIKNGEFFYAQETPSELERANEILMTGLRCTKGVDLIEIGNRISMKDFESLSKKIEKLIFMGMVVKNQEKLTIVPEKLFITDSIIAELAI